MSELNRKPAEPQPDAPRVVSTWGASEHLTVLPADDGFKSDLERVIWKQCFKVAKRISREFCGDSETVTDIILAELLTTFIPAGHATEQRATRAERERVLREEFEPWREKVTRAALEAAANATCELCEKFGWPINDEHGDLFHIDTTPSTPCKASAIYKSKEWAESCRALIAEAEKGTAP